VSILLLILPFVLLAGLVRLLPPWPTAMLVRDRGEVVDPTAT
jgi:hypothetical protein